MYNKALALALLMALIPACGDDDQDPSPKPDAAASDQKVAPADMAAGDMAPADLRSLDSAAPDQMTPDVGSNVVPTWVGRHCTKPEDCLDPPKSAVTDEQCLSGGEWVWPGGYCSRTCVAYEDCPAGAHCEELMATGPNPSVCILNCYNKSQCPGAGYVCAVVPGTNYGGCIPFD